MSNLIIFPEKIEEIHIDLDGTLHSGDIVKESALYLLIHSPIRLLLCIFRAIASGNKLKHHLAEEINSPVVCLRLNDKLIDWIKIIRSQPGFSAKIYINTGAPLALINQEVINRKIHNNGFITSDIKNRNIGLQKLAGRQDKKILYIGNSKEDFAIFDKIEFIGVVGILSSKIIKKYPLKVIYSEESTKFSYLKEISNLIRVRQWPKNLLVFTPIIFLNPITLHDLISLVGGFLLFCMLSSLVYIINDLYDINSDRAHPVKCYRPIASGKLSIANSILLAAALTFSMIILIIVIGGNLLAHSIILTIYLFLNIIYSIFLKKMRYINIFIMPIFYIIRVVFGLACVSISPSPTLLSFFYFGIFPLAILKRTREIELSSSLNHDNVIRGYTYQDIPHLKQLATAAIAIATSITALFWFTSIHNPSTIEGFLILLSIVLVFLALWLLTFERGDDDDTFGMVIKNKPFMITSVFFILIYILLTRRI